LLGINVAQRLKDAGLSWKPALGDRFAIPDRDLDDELFVLSNMTIQVYNLPEGRVIGFNGTTEWALDSIEQREVIWLPREEQLRAILGDHFQSLESVPGGYRVNLTDSTHSSEDAEQAYAAAAIHLLGA
jgi:hypothetical protein